MFPRKKRTPPDPADVFGVPVDFESISSDDSLPREKVKTDLTPAETVLLSVLVRLRQGDVFPYVFLAADESALLEDLSRKVLSIPKSVYLTMAIVQRESLLNSALESGDWRMALSVLDSLAKLLGLTDGVSSQESNADSLLELMRKAGGTLQN